MHGDVVNRIESRPGPAQDAGHASQRQYWGRRHRQTRRLCALAFVLIPVLLVLMWMEYHAARVGGGALLYIDAYCGCRAQVAHLLRGDLWTQMIWWPANLLALMIWCALGFKLWGGKRH